jgi:hypothetical protein
MEQLVVYKSFIDKGKGDTALLSHKKIQCHMKYDVKYIKQSKTRIAASIFIDPYTNSNYWELASLHVIRQVTFLA